MPVKTMAAAGKAARVFFALALLVAAGIARAELAGPVVAVLDGDTIDVLIDRQPVRVRLAQIDAPEKRQRSARPSAHVRARRLHPWCSSRA